MKTLRQRYPFSAIVGQEELKQALLLNLIYPGIGGVLIRGEKGTAKSTAVRALEAILPEIDVVDGCPCGCDPHGDALCPWCLEQEALESVSRQVRVVDLPVGSTEDRVVGSLDMETALREGRRRFEPGILADANRGILYVDEINLLDDHLVDVLLDAAAMGVNTVEREGVSWSHPSRFVLVGTMNPEEGELRPQLLDRFGLCVEVRGMAEPEARLQVMTRRAAFEDDPVGFRAAWQERENEIAERIVAARRDTALTYDDLKKIGVVLKRALYFITCSGRMMYRTKLDEDYICSHLMADHTQVPTELRNSGYQQLSLFDTGLAL